MEEGKLVEVVLAGGESHIGIVGTSPSFDFEGDVALAPALSGYRDSETHKLFITTDYAEQDDDFRIVALLHKVISVRHFDPSSSNAVWVPSLIPG